MAKCLADPWAITSRAPFWGVIGPNGTASPNALLEGWISFYEHFLQYHNAANAVAAFRHHTKEASVFLAEWVFAKAFQHYILNHLNPDAVDERVANIIKEFNTGRAVNAELVRTAICDFERDFYNIRATYLYIDLFPGSAGRFPIDYPRMLKIGDES